MKMKRISSDSLYAYKEFYRRRFREWLADLTPQARRIKNQRCFLILKKHPWVTKAETLFTYMNRSEEPDTERLIHWALSQKKKVVLPRVNPETQGLELFQIQNLKEDLRSGFLKIKEPDPRRCPSMPMKEIDVWIIPGLAFDPEGHRLGRGRGFFDRLLRQVSTKHILGLAFSDQILKTLPFDSHDQKVTQVITDQKIYKCAYA